MRRTDACRERHPELPSRQLFDPLPLRADQVLARALWRANDAAAPESIITICIATAGLLVSQKAGQQLGKEFKYYLNYHAYNCNSCLRRQEW